MIPNRHLQALDPVEAIAESAEFSTMWAVAAATGNWSLINVMKAITREAAEQRRERSAKKPPAAAHDRP